MNVRSQGPRVVVAMLAGVALGGCAGAQARMGSFLTSPGGVASASASSEKVFSVLWWTKADETQGLPYKPVEQASPEYDPATGAVYVATSDGKVHAFASDGRSLWDTEVGGPFNAGPALAGDRLYVGSTRGDLVALDANDGKVIWTYSAGDALQTRPVVSEGLVLVMTSSDTLLAIDAEKGDWKWQYRREVPGLFTLHGAARPAVADGRVFAGFADGYAVALDLADGGLLWAKQLSSQERFNDVDASPVVDDWGRVYFAAYGSGLYAIDAATGDTVWTYTKPGITALAIDPNNGRLFAGGPGFISAHAGDSGLPRWTMSMGQERNVTGLTVVDGPLLLAATGRGPLLFLDTRNGKLRKAFDPGHGVHAAATRAARGDTVVLSNRGYVYNLAIDAPVR
ncbi:MAG: PQQ-binding-like beta-propeller repeat protein [Myxococcales bacterium]|jgi:outer membrane protein assembly factor BamB